MPANLSPRYLEILERMKSARRIFALTGAGVSTLSGIPDFRTDKSGIWERFDQTKIFNIDTFRKSPHLFYEFAREWIYGLKDIKPASAHILLAEMEKRGMLRGIATQNIDGLHQESGSKKVYELHGHSRSSHCIECGKKYSREDTIQRLKNAPYPACDCKGAIKPDVIFYGEELPGGALEASFQEAMMCDLLIVMGTSLVVYPAALIPRHAISSGAKMILFNKTWTPFDDAAELIIRDDLKDVCGALLDAIKNE